MDGASLLREIKRRRPARTDAFKSSVHAARLQ